MFVVAVFLLPDVPVGIWHIMHMFNTKKTSISCEMIDDFVETKCLQAGNDTPIARTNYSCSTGFTSHLHE